ncbi:hypothetical protein K1T71_008882, partial [Dendrolimus kikuchii]
RKRILDNVCGEFNAGELTVIMGQSGAGKSSLMDILAGYTKQTSGNIYINGRIRSEAIFRRRSCYILQDDKVQEMLTVEESLTIAAQLKLGNHIVKQQKKQRVEEIIMSLGLNTSRNTRAVNLSGGEKKRLAIGLELVSDPSVLFLDEPTSGLDISLSKQMIYLLHLLARQGRTVIITMHQPSAVLLQMVDKLYAIANGRCAYMGSTVQLLPCMERLNLVCPPYHNPVDFLIEVCAETPNRLVESSQNGRNTEWVANNAQETDRKIVEIFNKKGCEAVFLTTLPSPKDDSTSRILVKLKSTYSTPPWIQFCILTRRALLSTWRNPSFTLMITGIHCAMALLVGYLFYNIGHDAKYVRDNYNFLYYSLMFLMFTAFSAVSINFPEQIPVVRREHFNRWYTAGAYYTSTLLAALPTQTVCSLCYSFITYWLTGQPVEFMRFFIFTITLLMVSYVSLCVGLLNGSMFNVMNGVVCGPFIIMPFTVFSGFFLRYSDSPYMFRWVFHASFLKHGLVGLVISIFGMDRPNLYCSDFYCHYTYPDQFLRDNGMLDEKYSIVVTALMCTGAVVITLSYLILKFRLKNKW